MADVGIFSPRGHKNLCVGDCMSGKKFAPTEIDMRLGEMICLMRKKNGLFTKIFGPIGWYYISTDSKI